MIIYKITNKINGKCYIGKTVRDLDERINKHIWHVKNESKYHIHLAIRKYGFENFTVDIIYETDDEDFLSRLEIFFIGYYDTYFNGYNMTIGGEGTSGRAPWNKGKKCSQLSEIQKGDKNHRWGKTLSEDHKKRIIKANKKPIILIHPSGEEEIFPCAKDACDKYNLNKGDLSSVLNDKCKTHKNFKAKFIKEE